MARTIPILAQTLKCRSKPRPFSTGRLTRLARKSRQAGTPGAPTVSSVAVNGGTVAIVSASESSTTVTITTNGSHGFTAGQHVLISGVSVAGYNGAFTIASAPTANTFTYTTTAGLGAATGGLPNSLLALRAAE